MARRSTVEGAEEVALTLQAMKTKLMVGAAQGINMWLERVRTAAVHRAPKYVGPPNPRIIPGLLRASAVVAYFDPNNPKEGGGVGFGVVYARRQHYETTWKHTVGEALYLRHAVEYSLPLLGLFISQGVMQALKEG